MEKKEEQLREAAKKYVENANNKKLFSKPELQSEIDTFIKIVKTPEAKQYHSSNDSVEGLQRYNLRCNCDSHEYCPGKMKEDENGDWVKYSDLKQQESDAEIKKLRRAIAIVCNSIPPAKRDQYFGLYAEEFKNLTQ